MKKLYTLSAILFLGVAANAQVFWTENFNNGCQAACTAVGYTGSNGAWSQTILGTEGADANAWYVSCSENGHTNGGCGTGCVAQSSTATLATLHISAKIGNPICPNDCGAAYDAGGLCGLLTCPQTNRRIESPVINCTGQSMISINFNYIEKGDGANDDLSLWYYDGTNWSLLDALAKTAPICPNQGMWTAFTLSLPMSANNNPNVRIGFVWINNDDGVGSDPSCAVDEITLASASLGISSQESSSASVFYDENGSIQVNANGAAYKVLGICNILGQESKFTQTENTLQLAEPTPGIYFVILEMNGVQVSKKVMVNK